MGKTTQKRVRRKMAFDLALLVGLSGVLFWLDLYTSIPDRLTVASEEQNTEIFQNIFPEWLEEAVVADGQGKSDIPSGNLTITGKLRRGRFLFFRKNLPEKTWDSVACDRDGTDLSQGDDGRRCRGPL